MSVRRTKWITGARLRDVGPHYHGENWFSEGQTQKVPGITVAHSLPKHRHLCGAQLFKAQPDSVTITYSFSIQFTFRGDISV